jgi:hypothetical protein
MGKMAGVTTELGAWLKGMSSDVNVARRFYRRFVYKVNKEMKIEIG